MSRCCDKVSDTSNLRKVDFGSQIEEIQSILTRPGDRNRRLASQTVQSGNRVDKGQSRANKSEGPYPWLIYTSPTPLHAKYSTMTS